MGLKTHLNHTFCGELRIFFLDMNNATCVKCSLDMKDLEEGGVAREVSCRPD